MLWQPQWKTERVTCCSGLAPARTTLSICHSSALTCRLRDVHDDAKDKPFELELSWLSEATGWRHVPVPADRIAAADAWAQAQIEAEDMGDD